MSKEIARSGEVMTIDFLAELLSKKHAFPTLVISNTLGRPVSYEELHAGLNSSYARLDKKGPSERDVRGSLGFLVRKKLLAFEVSEGNYRITPRGAEAALELSPPPR